MGLDEPQSDELHRRRSASEFASGSHFRRALFLHVIAIALVAQRYIAPPPASPVFLHL